MISHISHLLLHPSSWLLDPVPKHIRCSDWTLWLCHTRRLHHFVVLSLYSLGIWRTQSSIQGSQGHLCWCCFDCVHNADDIVNCRWCQCFGWCESHRIFQHVFCAECWFHCRIHGPYHLALDASQQRASHKLGPGAFHNVFLDVTHIHVLRIVNDRHSLPCVYWV